MGSSGVLARNFPTIDDAVFKDGEFTSYKTIDLEGKTYQTPKDLSRKLNTYLEKLETWPGQQKPWGGDKIDPEEISQKILHIGVPNGSMTPEQMEIFEQLGKKAKELDIQVKITAIEK